MINDEIPEPKFLTVLADSDGFVRWKCRLNESDVGNQFVELLVYLSSDGTLQVATRPLSERTWSPPVYCRRV
jgi:hypothetical protein